MKAAVTIITLVIIFAIVVFIGLMVWLYLNGFFTEVKQAGEVRTRRSLEVLSSCIKIEEASQNKFFIRNCGTGIITNDTLNVYVDGELIDFDLEPVSIEGGKTGSIILYAWGISIGQHSLRITNPNTEALAYFEAELPDYAVLILDFDEGEGTIAYDKSGYGNDGTLLPVGSGPQWVDGKFGKALKFDGIDDKITLEEKPSLQPTSLTIEAWIKPNDTSQSEGIIFDHLEWIGPDGYGYDFKVKKRTLRGCVGNGTDVLVNSYSYSIIIPDVWQHVAFTLNSDGYGKTYINGILTDESQLSTPIYDPMVPTIGSTEYDALWFNGTIDSMRIYNKALIPEETIRFRII